MELFDRDIRRLDDVVATDLNALDASVHATMMDAKHLWYGGLPMRLRNREKPDGNRYRCVRWALLMTFTLQRAKAKGHQLLRRARSRHSSMCSGVIG